MIEFRREDNYTQTYNMQDDNVSELWENELRRITLRPFLRNVVLRKLKNKKGLRILDMVSGNGKGYKLLTKIIQESSIQNLNKKYLIEEQHIDLYLGLDEEYHSIEYANDIYKHQKEVRFIRADYEKGLGVFKKVEKPFDIYLSHHASLSRLHKSELKDFLKDIVEHATKESIIILELLGKHHILNYFPTNGQNQIQGWNANEALTFLEEIQAETGVKLVIHNKMDFSIFVGKSTHSSLQGNILRHVREAINSLLTPQSRTDLNKLLIKEDILPDFSAQKVERNYQNILSCWNLFIQYAQHRIEHDLNPKKIQDWKNFPSTLQFALMTLHRLIKDTDWIEYGDRRADIIEPHIAYALRSFEYEFQQGLGCGQSLMFVISVKK